MLPRPGRTGARAPAALASHAPPGSRGMGPGLRIRCTVRSLGPRKPSPRLKPVLLQLIKEVLKRPRASRPRRHSLVLIVQKKGCQRPEPGSSANDRVASAEGHAEMSEAAMQEHRDSSWSCRSATLPVK